MEARPANSLFKTSYWRSVRRSLILNSSLKQSEIPLRWDLDIPLKCAALNWAILKRAHGKRGTPLSAEAGCETQVRGNAREVK